MVRTVLEVLNKLPNWLFFPVVMLIVIMVPVILSLAGVWFTLLEPRIITELEASVTTRAEIIETKYTHAIERQNLINKQTNDTLKSIQQHQSLMMDHLLKQKR